MNSKFNVPFTTDTWFSLDDAMPFATEGDWNIDPVKASLEAGIHLMVASKSMTNQEWKMAAWRIANAAVAIGGLINPLVGIIGGALMFLLKPEDAPKLDKDFELLNEMRATYITPMSQSKATSKMQLIVSELDWMPSMLRVAPRIECRPSSATSSRCSSRSLRRST